MRELCPDCRTELIHFTLNGEDVFGCPECNREIPRELSIKVEDEDG